MFPNLFDLSWIWKAIAALVMLFWGATVAGCAITTTNDGAMWIEFSHRVEIGHRAAKTSDESATAAIDGKALVNHIVDLREPEGEGEPDG